MARTPRSQFFLQRFPPTPQTNFFFLRCITLARMFRDLPITARELKATPATLERIYDGAKLGLRGDSLALAAGLLPVELARLKLMDPIAEIAEMKGRADSEMTMSRTLYEAAEAGDSKAALEFLRHRHDWVAKQQVQVDVAQSISITAALEMAEKRVRAAEAIEDAVEIRPRDALARPQALAEMGPV
jgi:predicted transcriptional regulator